MPPWEELDRKLANSDLIGPADENLFNYPAESQLPVNLEPAIPDPIVNPDLYKESWKNGGQLVGNFRTS
ncbi:hypothetical protein HanPI659440_Chr14g0561221 [Helianthus annuus]|nr:hypothetical protein HanPI659440_Chr14g0561221 [Helianthus annuus]